jgi:prevent-host-death family protein
MKTVKLSDAKDQLSKYVEAARRGAVVRILVRGEPAADLVPVNTSSAAAETDLPLVALERLGLIRRGRGGVPDEIFKPGPRARGRSIADLVVDERQERW